MKNVFFFICLFMIGAYIISCKPQTADMTATGDTAMLSPMTKEDSI